MGDCLGKKYKKYYSTRPYLLILMICVFFSILIYPSIALADDVTLAWDASSGADGYRLFSREEGQSYNYSSPDWEGTTTTGTVTGLTQGTTYYFVARAYNADGESGDSNEESTTIGSTNQPPVLDPIGSKSVDEGTLLTFTVTASDPDGDGLTFSAGNVPPGASFNPSTRVFSWTPAFGDAGNYNVTFTVTDDGTPTESDSETVTISVGNVNRPPVLGAIGSKNVDEGDLLSFTVTASDPDGDGLTFSANNLPSGASFNPSTRVFSCTLGFGAAGNYNVTFTVTDDGTPAESDSEVVTISVGNVNRPPVLGAIGYKSVDEGDLLSFTISASDPDGDILTYSASNLPSGANFNSGTRTFSWTPAIGDAGNYNVQFTVTDDGSPPESDLEIVTITVVDSSVGNLAPDQPVIISPYYGETETDLLLSVETESFSDPDGDAHSMSQWQVVKQSDSSVVLEIESSEHLTKLPVPHAVLDRETTYSASVQFYDSYSEPSEWSDPVEFTTITDVVDLDDDGVPDGQEVDDTVDLNQDGTPDNDQPDTIKSTKSAVAGKQPVGVCKVSTDVDGIVVLEPIHPSEILDKKNKPKKFLFGLAAYRLKVNQVGATIQVKVYYSEDISGDRYYLYDTVNGWQDYTQYTTFNPDGRSVTVELKDGGHGDSDGVANGIIVDPGGVADAASGGLDSGAGGGCFIATAAFGSDVGPQVKLHAASYNDGHDWLKPIVRILLMPLVGVKYILVRTYLVTVILLGFMLIVSVLTFYSLIYKGRRRRA
jgi:hypothetical protein